MNTCATVGDILRGLLDRGTLALRYVDRATGAELCWRDDLRAYSVTGSRDVVWASFIRAQPARFLACPVQGRLFAA